MVTDFLSHRLVARLAGYLYIVGSLLLAPALLLPGSELSTVGVLVVAGLGVGVGIVVLVLPWQRWPRWASLCLVPPALGLIALGNGIQVDPWLYGIYFVVVFAWVGVAHPQMTSLLVLPLAVAAYAAPVLWTDVPTAARTAAPVILGVCVLVGEGLAWVASRARQAERTDIHRMRAMEALVNATSELARQAEPGPAADLVADYATRLTDGDAGLVLLVDPEGGVRGAGGHRWPTPAAEIHARWLDAPAREALATGRVATHSGSPLAGDLTVAAAGAPVIFIPLAGTARPLGLIMVAFSSEADTELDAFTAGLVRTFAAHAGLSFERLRATERLIEASRQDPLTGVGNRRAADETLARLGPGDAVGLLDLDHFKRVNDRYGHAVGDRVLFDLAHFLESVLREGDSVARFGGEEFLVILKRVGEEAARPGFERIAHEWRETDPVTSFSIGVAVHDGDSTPTETLARADAAMYAAKRAGRNRVVMAGDEVDSKRPRSPTPERS